MSVNGKTAMEFSAERFRCHRRSLVEPARLDSAVTGCDKTVPALGNRLDVTGARPVVQELSQIEHPPCSGALFDSDVRPDRSEKRVLLDEPPRILDEHQEEVETAWA